MLIIILIPTIILTYITVEDSDDNLANLGNFQNWADFAAVNTHALIAEMNSLNAISFNQEIPEFLGELDKGITKGDRFKISDTVATTAGWEDKQKLR